MGLFKGRAPMPRRPRILVIDDEPDVLESVATLIQHGIDADVETVTSAREGLGRMGQESFDLVVTDFRMPGMDGCEFLAEASKVAPTTPRIMMSAYSDAALEARAWALGLCLFFAKPLLPESFLPGVRHCMRAA
ncbi:MAG TPA: response regulator [Candidatus Thermoplasmatota archaeon]|nr:response regulator [Candidatus Thermoplasmatota archaeon]